MFDYVKENIDVIKSKIHQACEKSGIDEKGVQLIAVTKTYEVDVINTAIKHGVTDIAENRVQEIIRKYDAIQEKVKWHLIGQLQTNKVKYIIDKVSLIHSVDSIKLANEIQKHAAKIGKVQEVLVQVNVAGEVQKSGVSKEGLPELLEHIKTLKNIKVCGLMNIAPFVDDPETLRSDFREMKTLFDGLRNYNSENIVPKYLSMGMSSDFEVAISEGANMIRIGTSIFGKRI